MPESLTKRQLLVTRAYVNLNDPEAEKMLDKLSNETETKTEVEILKAIHLKNQGKLEAAAGALDSALETETPEAWLTFGKIHWEMSDFGHSLMAFLKGIHADPYNWECFLYLGHYYREHGNDVERARKCYQKALQINSNSEEAGIGLSTAYRLLKSSVSFKLSDKTGTINIRESFNLLILIKLLFFYRTLICYYCRN